MSSTSQADQNVKVAPDKVLIDIATYVQQANVEREDAYKSAYYCFIDALGCAFLALNFPACTKLLGPIVSGTQVPNGARVPATEHVLDPVKAAWDFGIMVRWLDFNDTWLAKEWGHPSDNLGAILMVCDYLNRAEKANLTMRDVFNAMIKAYEIQGGLALENSFNEVGLDHVLLVKVASAAVVAQLLGADHQQIVDTVSHAWLDGSPLRTYRHAPNTGTRKSWASGDASSRALYLAQLILKGEQGYPSVLTAKNWGFYDTLFGGKPFTFQRPYSTYVIENILLKISYPAEFHAQTAVEVACGMHKEVIDKLDAIERIDIVTHEAAVRIISKVGSLYNPADRDHCLQYMIAVALLKGNVVAEDYEEDVANDPRIDALREKMHVTEDPQYTQDYFDPEKRAIPNAIQIKFSDGTSTDRHEMLYPIGHKRRRSEGIPLLMKKARHNFSTRFSEERCAQLFSIIEDYEAFSSMSVDAFVDQLVQLR